MRLLIISHTAHYRAESGLVGWGPTVREIDRLSQLFDQVTHVAMLHEGEPPDSCIPYDSCRVQLRPLRPSGGGTLKDKVGILARYPGYARVILQEMRKADVVHVRCPANIGLLALALLTLTRRPTRRWTKYACNWHPSGKEAWSFTLQRWLLGKGLQRGVVTVNGKWTGQPGHVHSFYNPCLTDEELAEASEYASQKDLCSPLRLVFVGRLDRQKGVERALRVLAELRDRGIDARLDLVGDGPDRPYFQLLASELGLGQAAGFHGWIPRPKLSSFYAGSHIMLFPSSSSEGWPKVLSEAMAYGVVPVASNISSIPQFLHEFGVGRTFPPDDLPRFADAIAWYASHPDSWRTESENAVRSAALFSYGNYLRAVCDLLRIKEPDDLRIMHRLATEIGAA